jgi:hypothetical protein
LEIDINVSALLHAPLFFQLLIQLVMLELTWNIEEGMVVLSASVAISSISHQNTLKSELIFFI